MTGSEIESVSSVTNRLLNWQVEYVRLIAAGAKPLAALQKAGYPESPTSDIALSLLAHPAVKAAIRMEIERQAQTVGAAAAYKAALEAAENTQLAPRDRLKAAQMLGIWAGLTPAPGASKTDPTRTLADKTPSELRAFIEKQEEMMARAEAELADRAKPIDAHNGAPATPDDEAFLG